MRVQHVCGWLIALLVLSLPLGCAVVPYEVDRYDTRQSNTRQHLRNVPHAALRETSRRIGVLRQYAKVSFQNVDQLPSEVAQRGVLYHYLGQYRASNRDLEDAYKSFEEMALRKPHVAQTLVPHDRFMLHTIALLNHLALHNLQGALVEARRIARFRHEFSVGAYGRRLPLGHADRLAAYLSAYAFEKSGSWSEAEHLYGYADLDVPIFELSGNTLRPSDPARNPQAAEVLIVAMHGFGSGGRYQQHIPLQFAYDTVCAALPRAEISTRNIHTYRLAQPPGANTAVASAKRNDTKLISDLMCNDAPFEGPPVQYRLINWSYLTDVNHSHLRRNSHALQWRFQLAVQRGPTATFEPILTELNNAHDPAPHIAMMLAGHSISAWTRWDTLPSSVTLAKLRLEPGHHPITWKTHAVRTKNDSDEEHKYSGFWETTLAPGEWQIKTLRDHPRFVSTRAPEPVALAPPRTSKPTAPKTTQENIKDAAEVGAGVILMLLGGLR